MSEQDSQSIEVKILERSYMVGCPPEKQDELTKSAKYLDRKMREIRESGKVIGTERIAIMAALNIAYEMLYQNVSISANDEDAQDQLQRINQKLSAAIKALRQDDEKTDAA